MSNVDVSVDTSNLFRLYEALGPKERAKALRGGLRQAGNIIVKAIKANVSEAGINAPARLLRALGVKIKKGRLGFSAGLNAKTELFRYTSRRSKSGHSTPAPVLSILEWGTKAPRSTHRRYNRGEIKRYGFVKKAGEEYDGRVTGMIQTEIGKYIMKVFEKYG